MAITFVFSLYIMPPLTCYLICFFVILFFPFLWFLGIDLNEQNNGKASILCEASRLLKDLLCQIESLKKENVSLLSESNYVRLALFSSISLHFTLFRVLHVEF